MTVSPLQFARVSELDAALLIRLSAAFPEDAWDAANASAFVRNADNLLVLASWDGEPCGWLTAHRLQRLDGRVAEVLIYEIGVADAYQRRGVGSALIAAATRWAGEVGADEAWVLTNRSNAAAMALYRATGGVEDAPDVTMFTYTIGDRGPA